MRELDDWKLSRPVLWGAGPGDGSVLSVPSMLDNWR